MKILATIIAHPLRKIAGATNAGRDLSVATADLVDLELAIMWDRDETLTIGKLPVHHLQCTNPLDFAAPWVPRSVRVPLYDSKIPERIRDGATTSSTSTTWSRPSPPSASPGRAAAGASPT